MPAVFDYFHTVVAADLDSLGHANNVSYLVWMQSAAVAHSAAQGWPTEAYQRLGAGWVVRSHQIEYLRPAFAGDAIVVRTWVADTKKATSLRRYQILRRHDSGPVTLAVAATDWAFVDFATGILKRIPPEVAGAFEVVAGPAPESAGT
ncbi:MAG: acyl-CoA thioesterase [Planctomycetaceae bacterium]